eukprot:6029839-Pyramimonas_sp.AAC.1
MKAARQGVHLHVASQKLGLEAGANVDMSVARQVLHRGSLSKQEAGILQSFLCQTVWAGRELQQAGYEASS